MTDDVIRLDAHKDEFHRDQQWHKPVRVATTASITISTGLNNGDTIDGVTLATGDRVLLKDQSTGSQNGIYVVRASPGRAYDMLTGLQTMGSFVYVIAGTTNGGKVFRNTNTSLPTVGSTTLTFSEWTGGSSSSSSGRGFDVTPPQSVPMPAWVKPTGTGVITADPQGRITVDSGTTYRAFPSMAFLAGRLYLVYRDGSAHNSAGGVVKLRTSSDLGRTWASATTIATPGGTDDNRDPIIGALSSGRLLLYYHRTGTGGTVALDIRVRYSDDRGQTWSAEYTVPDTFSGQVAGSGSITELPNGTILISGYGESGGNYSAVTWSSTDGGLTFGSQTTIASSGSRDFDEPQVHYLASGKLVALLRTNGTGHTYRAVSTDLGATWAAATDVLTAGLGRPDFVEFYPGALLLFVRVASGDDDAGWAVSWDEGATWTAVQEVDTGETQDQMYSGPVLLAPGYVAVAYALEASGTDADIYLRYYYDGYGMDPIGGFRSASLYLPTATSPAQTTDGQAVWDSDDDVLTIGTGAARKTFGYLGTTTPVVESGSGSAGSSNEVSHVDHVHPAATSGTDHVHVFDVLMSGDGATTAFELPAAPFDEFSVQAFVSGTLTEVTLSGTMLTTATFGSAPASATNNIRFDIVAAVA
jgi:hypothetical protein